MQEPLRGVLRRGGRGARMIKTRVITSCRSHSQS